MEKSFLTFVATYPTWQPPQACRQVLDVIGSVSAAAAGAATGGTAAGAGVTSYMRHQPAGFTGIPAAGVGACAGMGAVGMDSAGAGMGADSVMWQHPYGSSNGAVGGMAGTIQSPGAYGAGAGQQSAAPSGTSSVWVGVAEAPTGLRHPNHPRQQQQEQQVHQQRGVYSPYQQQVLSPTSVSKQQQQYQQQQQQEDAAGGMGAGLGGLGSSPPKHTAPTELATAKLLDEFSSSSPAAAVAAQQQHDGFADAMFEPLSPPAGAHDQQQQQHNEGTAVGQAAFAEQQQQQQRPFEAVRVGKTAGDAPGQQQLHGSQVSLPRQQQQQQQRPPWHARQQYQQQQQQNHQMLLLQLSQYSSSLLPGMASTRGPSGPGSALQPYPSTLYPGGPSAAAALSHHLQPPAPAAAAGRYRHGAQGSVLQVPGQHAVNMPALQQQQQQQVAPGASLYLGGSVFQGNSLAGSDFLPTNEREDLSSRIAASQSLLQSYYESQVCVHENMDVAPVLVPSTSACAPQALPGCCGQTVC